MAGEITEGTSLAMIQQWNRLEILHYDLNTCLCETRVMLKSFFCVLPSDELREFRKRLVFRAPATAAPSRRSDSSLPRLVPACRQPAIHRAFPAFANFPNDSPLPHQSWHNRDNSGSRDCISRARMRPDGTGGSNETN